MEVKKGIVWKCNCTRSYQIVYMQMRHRHRMENEMSVI